MLLAPGSSRASAGSEFVFAYVAQPHNGTTMSADSSLTASVQGWSRNAAVTKVKLFMDGSPVGIVTGKAGTVCLTNLAAGIHELTAVALDASSNHGTSAPVYIRAISSTKTGGSVSGERSASGKLKLWHPVNVDFTGPNLSENGDPNPFTDYRLDVTFVNGTNVYLVPGYFAADGNAANTGATKGTIWRARFSPVADGTWTYYASFRTGTDVATNDNAFAGSATAFDGQSGSFEVGPTDKTGNDFRAKGLLDYVGGCYLRFRGTGKYFLKTGAGSPENFLGYFAFDNTKDHGGSKNALNTTNPIAGAPGFDYHGDGLHHWGPHLSDWKTGDPVWQGSKGKGIIGAVNYLGSVGANSLYFLTMNPNGDGREVYPWTTYANAPAPDPGRYRFDCSKLDQWDEVFSQMDAKGVFKDVFLAETENDLLLDGGALGKERRLYYREMVARFSHCLGLQWDISEECDNTTAQIMAYCAYIHRLDPFYHTIHAHNHVGKMKALYGPLLGFPLFDGPAFQEKPGTDHASTLLWRSKSIAAGHPWILGFDEQNPAGSGVVPDHNDPTHNIIRKRALWGNLMAGGTGCEWYFGYHYPNTDLDCETFATRSNMWRQGVIAREFFSRYLPFQNMTPNDVLSSASGSYCLAQTGHVYAVYLPKGGSTTLDLTGARGTYTVRWYDPRHGGILQTGTVSEVTGGGAVSLGNPPSAASSDWAVLVKAISPASRVLRGKMSGGHRQLR